MSSTKNIDAKKPSTSSTRTGASTSPDVIKSLFPVINNFYPVALASHDEVVNDCTLFMNTLESFHFAIGSKLVIPIVGKKDLDLHGLYVEVTRRGGYEKVVKNKKWREVGNTVGFPITTTTASYELRKQYLLLLHRYEFVYFSHKECCC